MANASTLYNRSWSFVQLNDFDSNSQTECYPELKNKCLPIFSLDEIAFQMGVAEFAFPTGFAEFYLIPVAVDGDGLTQISPCETISTEGGVPIAIESSGQFFTLDDCTDSFAECEPGIFAYDLTGTGAGATLPDAYALMKYYIQSQSGSTGVDADMVYASQGEWIASTFPTAIPVGQCFRFIIVQTNTDISGNAQSSYRIGCTNCFVRIDDVCDTSIVQYRGFENQFDFIYDDPTNISYFWNRIRLPFYLRFPQFTSVESGYKKSDGRFVKLSERVQKEYDLVTDYMPEVWHEKFKLALSSDEIIMENTNITTDRLQGSFISVYCNEPYEIEWLENWRMAEAPARTKVIRNTDVAYLNSNCNNG